MSFSILKFFKTLSLFFLLILLYFSKIIFNLLIFNKKLKDLIILCFDFFKRDFGFFLLILFEPNISQSVLSTLIIKIIFYTSYFAKLLNSIKFSAILLNLSSF